MATTFLTLLVTFLASLPSNSQNSSIVWKGSTTQLSRRSSAETATQLAAFANQGKRHILVQFERGLQKTEIESLKSSGLELLHPLGKHSYFAAIAPNSRTQQLAAFSALQFASPIDHKWKMHPRIEKNQIPKHAIVNDNNSENPRIALYALFFRDVPLIGEATKLVEKHGASIRDYLPSVNGMVVEIDRSKIAALSAEDALLWLEPPLPILGVNNDSNRTLTQANTVQASPYSLTGSGVSVIVYDGGNGDSTHPDFGGRLYIRDSAGLATHPTHVAGTIGSSGTQSGGVYRGMATAVTLQSYGFQGSGGGIFLYTNPGDFEQDYTQAIQSYSADLANNSIGTNICGNLFDCDIAGDYGVMDQIIDETVRGSLGNPITVVWANGNERGCSRCVNEGTQTTEGYRSVAPPACAKNHITVGAVYSNSDVLVGFSSWGPTDDGRMKPDLVAPGCQSDGDFGVTSTGPGGTYVAMCGTSMAAPTVTGLVALMLQDYRSHFTSQPDPKGATVKALLTHTAQDIEATGPDYKSGFGSVRIKDAIDYMRSNNYDNFLEHSIDQDESFNIWVRVQSGDTVMKATLAWDDYPATPNVELTLVNDLDLRVFDPNNVLQYPWTLNPNSPSSAAVKTGPDRLNNIEQVLINNPAVGLWRVQVRGYNVAEGPQTFSLCVSPRRTRDCDNNSLDDEAEILADPDLDICGSNGLLNSCEVDCNNDDLWDSCTIWNGLTPDCNGNEMPEGCETYHDCNNNMVNDNCDIKNEVSEDCDGNWIPDECTSNGPNCNENSIPDSCEIAQELVPDCNQNGIPDSCDIANATSFDCNDNDIPDDCETDCNNNDVPDDCDLEEETSEDCDGNEIPDECDRSLNIWVAGNASEAFLNGMRNAGHQVTKGAIPDVLDNYDALIVAPNSGWGSYYTTLVDNYVYSGGNLIWIQGDPATHSYYGSAFPATALSGWELRNNTTIIESQSPLVLGLYFISSLQGYSTTPTLKSGAETIKSWIVGSVPMEVLYSYGSGNTLWFNDQWACYNPHNWAGDTSYGTALMLHALSYLGRGDCNGNEVLDVCETDCNNNETPDTCDVATGSSQDSNSNQVPDECELVAPTAASEGGRYLKITPGNNPYQVAIQVIRVNGSCSPFYVQSNGLLGSSPVYKTPANWGTVYVKGPEIVPSKSYQVRVVISGGFQSPQVTATTRPWGDVTKDNLVNSADIDCVMAAYSGNYQNCSLQSSDIHGTTPNGLINLDDILRVLNAVGGTPYPYTDPCQ